jgi:hypothetical protein
VRLRALAVTTALALAVTGLSACTSKVGQAAVVGSERISTKDVDRYINPKGPTAAGIASEQGQAIAPRVLVLQTMVDHDLFLGVLKKSKSGAPSTAQLHAQHDAVASQISQGQATGAAFDAALKSQLVSLGFQSSFTAYYIETQEMEAVLASAVRATTQAEFVAAIAKAKVGVSVSPRYGSWDPTNFDLTTTGKAGRPPFVTIGTDVPVAPSSTAPAGQ